MQFIVQVFCTGMGWVDSKHGGDTRGEAETAEKALLADDSAWVNPEAPRQTRIKEVSLAEAVFTVRDSAFGELLCKHGEPVFNLSANRLADRTEQGIALGLPRKAVIREINAYRRVTTPHAFTDINRRG